VILTNETGPSHKNIQVLEKKKKLRKKGFIHTSNKVNKDLGYGLISESSHGTLRSAET
jgi:hypothetical protein